MGPAAAGSERVIRVVVVDDQTLVRQGICRLLDLTSDIRVVAEAADGAEAIRLIPTVDAEVVLLDVRMPGQGGIEVLQALAGHLPPTILLTTFDDDAVVIEAARHGAKGFLLKDVSLEQLAEAIRAVAAGRTMMLPALTERVLKGLPGLRQDFDSLDRPDPLTPREAEVLRLIAGGYSNREIADALGTAEGTVKNHASSILSKLGVRDRTRAVLKALDLGLL
jgi:DNA-binding NarL/FixJ family response regulator